MERRKRKMAELLGIFALWYREFKVFTREKSRIVSSIINPILWLFIIGGGLGASVNIAGLNYQTFIYPGTIAQTLLFSSIFFGAYIVWDRKVDFLKEVLVAPISRTSTFLGKVLGGCTDGFIQAFILLCIGLVLGAFSIIPGLHITLLAILLSLAIVFVSLIGFVSIGLIIGSQMESPEGFQLIGTFVIFPLFFLSGALFPINNLPKWMAPITFMDPVTYSVDGLRGVILGTSFFHPLYDFAIVAAFSLLMILVGTFAFSKMKV